MVPVTADDYSTAALKNIGYLLYGIGREEDPVVREYERDMFFHKFNIQIYQHIYIERERQDLLLRVHKKDSKLTVPSSNHVFVPDGECNQAKDLIKSDHAELLAFVTGSPAPPALGFERLSGFNGAATRFTLIDM